MQRETAHSSLAQQTVHVTVCAHCGKLKNRNGNWIRFPGFWRIKDYVRLSHGICPACALAHFGEYFVVDRPAR